MWSTLNRYRTVWVRLVKGKWGGNCLRKWLRSQKKTEFCRMREGHQRKEMDSPFSQVTLCPSSPPVYRPHWLWAPDQLWHVSLLHSYDICLHLFPACKKHRMSSQLLSLLAKIHWAHVRMTMTLFPIKARTQCACHSSIRVLLDIRMRLKQQQWVIYYSFNVMSDCSMVFF